MTQNIDQVKYDEYAAQWTEPLPLRSALDPEKIFYAALDTETLDDVENHRVKMILGSIMDSSGLKEFSSEEEMTRYIFTTRPRIIGVHNPDFDVRVFLDIQTMHDCGYKLEMFTEDQPSFYIFSPLTKSKKYFRITIFDTYAYMAEPLEKLAVTVGMQHIDFPDGFIKAGLVGGTCTDWCECRACRKKHCRCLTTRPCACGCKQCKPCTLPHPRSISDAVNAIRSKNLNDTKITYELTRRIASMNYDRQGNKIKASLPAWSMETSRMYQPIPYRKIRGGLIENCYTAGRIELFTKTMAEAVEEDLKSAYGWAMTQPLPYDWKHIPPRVLNTPTVAEVLKQIDDGYGAAIECMVEVPTRYQYGLIPYKTQTRLIYPVGKFIAHIMHPEFKILAEYADIVPVKAMFFEMAPFMKPYVDYCLQQRRAAPAEWETEFWKLAVNSRYGKFIQRERDKVTLASVEDLERKEQEEYAQMQTAAANLNVERPKGGFKLHSPEVYKLAEELFYQHEVANGNMQPTTPEPYELEEDGYLRQALEMLRDHAPPKLNGPEIFEYLGSTFKKECKDEVCRVDSTAVGATITSLCRSLLLRELEYVTDGFKELSCAHIHTDSLIVSAGYKIHAMQDPAPGQFELKESGPFKGMAAGNYTLGKKPVRRRGLGSDYILVGGKALYRRMSTVRGSIRDDHLRPDIVVAEKEYHQRDTGRIWHGRTSSPYVMPLAESL